MDLKMSEDDDTIQQPRSKTVVFTLEERKLLLKLVNMHLDVLNNKKVDSASTLLKNQAWEAIHKKYMEHTGLIKLPRTPQQLKRCWENMKCKAKKGDTMSVKLLKWAEGQYKLMQAGGKDSSSVEKNGSSSLLDSLDEDSDSEMRDDTYNYEPKVKVEEPQLSASQMLEDKISKLRECVEKSNCLCDKQEKSAKIDFLAMQKRQSEELHYLKTQLIKERIRREKELHKLCVHEMSLKVENERRRAEILDKELKYN